MVDRLISPISNFDYHIARGSSGGTACNIRVTSRRVCRNYLHLYVFSNVWWRWLYGDTNMDNVRTTTRIKLFPREYIRNPHGRRNI